MSISNHENYKFHYPAADSRDDFCKKPVTSSNAPKIQIDKEHIKSSIKSISTSTFLKDGNAIDKNVLSSQRKIEPKNNVLKHNRNEQQPQSLSYLKTTVETTNVVHNALKSGPSKTFHQVPAEAISQAQKNRERMMNTLGLNVIPDIPEESEFKTHSFYKNYEPSQLIKHYKKCNEDKKIFIEQHFDLSKVALVLTQVTKFPEMQQALNLVRGHLDRWDDLSLEKNSKALNGLKRELQIQMKNLSILCDDLDKISKKRTSNLSPPISPEEFKKESAKLRERRKKDAVTTSSIQQQAKLHQAIRASKVWTSRQPKLKKIGTSSNRVYRLNSINTNTPTAFFKVGRKNEMAAGTMEKLMWDIAVVMGSEDKFVPTGETRVRTRKELTGGIEPTKPEGIRPLTKQWDEKGELKELTGAMPGQKGGIQVAQKGNTFEKLIDDGISISKISVPRDEIIEGILTSLVFGMFDAHTGNIFLTDEGKIKFFDNTRALPNSNGFIDRGFRLTSAYRCSLLDLDCAKTPLTPHEIDKLKVKITDYQQKMNQLKKYLGSKEIQSRLKTLPPGWMDLTASLAAMEKRISLMETALNTDQVKTLENLVTQSNPSYKFAYALTHLELILEAGQSNVSLAEIHTAVGYYPIYDTIHDANKLGIQLKRVEKWCKDPAVSTDELSKRLVKHYDEMKTNPLTKTKKFNNRKRNNIAILKKITASAAPDYKDLTRKEALKCTDKRNVKTLCQNEVKVLPKATAQTVENAMHHAKNNNLKAVIIGNKENRQIIQNTPLGFRVKEFDASLKHGMIREKFQDSTGKTILGNEMPIAHFNKSVVNPSDVIKYDELPTIPQILRDEMTIQKGLLISKALDGNLTISFRSHQISGINIVVNKTFALNTEGEFLVPKSSWLEVTENSSCTINQIVDLFQKKLDKQ